MLRLGLRRCVVSNLLSSASALGISPLRRLLSASASAAPISPNPSDFAVEEYLAGTCGLARPQALKASTKLSHLKSPAKPDAILAFLAGLGLSAAAVVAKDPLFLCAKVDKTLAPVVAGLTGLGLSRSDIASLVSLASPVFRCRTIVSRLQYYLPLFGSFHNLFRVLKGNCRILSPDLDKAVKPNVVFLRECGLGDCDIAKLCIRKPRLLTTKLERVQAMAACAERLGLPPGSGMFKQALHAVAFLNEDKIANRVEYLKNVFRWSHAEVAVAVSKTPNLLRRSKDVLRRMSAFLISEVGLEPARIARRPVILTYSLEGRLRPRHYVIKFVKANGLLDCDRSYIYAVDLTENVFVEKFVRPHIKAAPHLAEDYAAACRGEVPTRFTFS